MPRNRRQLLHLLAAGGLGIAGCMGGGEGDSPAETRTATATETDQPATATTSGTTIDMTGSSFDPIRASVDPGATVTWRNDDGVGHTVTAAQFHDAAADWSIDERADGGSEITHTFADAGVYEYYCTIHGRGTMCGVVLVGDATLDATLPCEDDGGGIDY